MSRTSWLCLGLLGCQAVDAVPPTPPRAPAARFSEVNVHFAGSMVVPFRYDWAELENPTGQVIDLTGHFLTEDLLVPQMWRFPDGTTLAVGERLVVLSPESARDAEEAGVLIPDFLVLDFQLDVDGESLHLMAPGEFIEPAASVIWGPSPSLFDSTVDDWPAWARDPDADDTWRWTTTPTPGEANVIAPDTGLAP